MKRASPLAWGIFNIVNAAVLFAVTTPEPFMHGVNLGPILLLVFGIINLVWWWRER